jgi:hypothetical protein
LLGRGFADTRAFIWPSNESGSQSIVSGRFEIAAVSGAHHALAGLEIKGISRRKIDCRSRLEVSCKVGTQYRIPTKVIPSREIRHYRDIAIGDGGNEETLSQSRKTRRHIVPGVKAMPRQG